MKRRLLLLMAGLVPALHALPVPAAEPAPAFTFPSIDGGDLDLGAWRGHPVLVVNTASMCGFAGQLRDMQAVHDAYGPRGLMVLAVPSDDFEQELASGAEAREYCQMEYGLTLPMTDIVHVVRGDVHPFYAWLRAQTGFVPQWNFNKVLLGPDGQVLGEWGSFVPPGDPAIIAAAEPFLS